MVFQNQNKSTYQLKFTFLNMHIKVMSEYSLSKILLNQDIKILFFRKIIFYQDFPLFLMN